MNHLMIDLETMGNKPTAPIVSIGAVFFDPITGNIGASFECSVELTSVINSGAKPDGDTIIWWMKQSDEARRSITTSNSKLIEYALDDLDVFINQNANSPKYLQVWGNGAPFDNVILREHYARMNREEPWKWWNDRDVRTIVEIGKSVGFDPKLDMPFEVEKHNALADAIHQAKYVSAIWKKLTA